MRNHHNQSDNAPYYVISRVSFQARVFCINRLSYYEGGGMTHTCRKVTQILYFTLINCIFSLSLLNHMFTFGKCVVLLGQPEELCTTVLDGDTFVQGAFWWPQPASSKSVNCEQLLSFFPFRWQKRKHSFNKSNIFFLTVIIPKDVLPMFHFKDSCCGD